MRLPTPAGLLRLGAIAAVLALALTLYVAANPAPVPGDLRVARGIQELGRLRDNARLINAAGDWRWLPFAAVFVLVAAGRRLGAGRSPARLRRQALVAFLVALPLWYWSAVLKMLVASPRPIAGLGLYIDRVRDSYGFPSGHVYGDVLLYGVMAVFAAAWLHPRWVLVARGALVALIVLAGPARVIVGAHWPSDVLGAYLWGIAALALAVAAGRRFG